MNIIQAQQLLQTALNNPDAKFCAGQWEAIDAVVNQRKKLLLVQRTGWGKSLLYFICTKIFHDRYDTGLTIVVSPRDSLITKQKKSPFAQHLKIKTGVDLLPNNQPDKENQIDCLFIRPEKLIDDWFYENKLKPNLDRIKFMVIEEAHRISEDKYFRKSYNCIVDLLSHLPDTPVLCTTATVNDRVVNDIKEQINGIQILRGSLNRTSLALQTIKMQDQAYRLTCLATVIPTLSGNGIVYTRTKNDADQVAKWLNKKGIRSKAYYSGIENLWKLEVLLFTNKLDVLVATSVPNKSYKKLDVSFVIHYQAPSSIVTYYQHVDLSRKGDAVSVLMSDTDDQEVPSFLNRNHSDQRNKEWMEVQDYIDETGCKMMFLCRALGDNDTKPCGNCASCIGKPVVDLSFDFNCVNKAKAFLKEPIIIQPNKTILSLLFNEYDFLQNPLPYHLRAQEGRALSYWPGVNNIVQNNKDKGYFSNDLVSAMAKMIKNWKLNPEPEWVCCVPSRDKPELVPDFAKRLAKQLEWPFIDAVSKVNDNQPQKNQQLLHEQSKNLDGVFIINQSLRDTPVLLVDDIVKSGMTLTVIAALLQHKGSGCVYPVALASLVSKQ